MWSIIPYLIGLFFFASSRFVNDEFHPTGENTSIHIISDDDYKDTYDGNAYLRKILLPSRYVEEDFLEVFISNAMYKQNKFMPCYDTISKNELGLQFFGDLRSGFNEGSKKYELDADNQKDINNKKVLDCLSSHFKVMISDSVQQNISYDFYRFPKTKQQGLLAIIDLKGLSRGKKVFTFVVLDKENREHTRADVVFWKK